MVGYLRDRPRFIVPENYKHAMKEWQMREVTFEEISEEIDDSKRPWLDRRVLSELQTLDQFQKQWRDEGVVVLKNFLPDPLIAAYSEVREKLDKPGGWPDPIPYMRHKALRDIACYKPLMDIMEGLIGAPMGLHLCLTGWVSTERNWHQDDYLNPEHVNSWYTAVWMALDDIHPDSGPFQYVKGSHRWPVIRQEKVFNIIGPEAYAKPTWPSDTQDWVAKACENEIARRGETVIDYLPKKGDVLIWHGCLMHRGSRAKVPGMMRKALISHYSALSKRPDMPNYTKQPGGGHYFEINGRAIDSGS